MMPESNDKETLDGTKVSGSVAKSKLLSFRNEKLDAIIKDINVNMDAIMTEIQFKG